MASALHAVEASGLARFMREALYAYPLAETAQHEESGNILVAIRPNGEIWMDRRQVDLREVRPTIERLHLERPEDTVVVLADKAARTGLLAQVMDEIKLGGIQEVGIGAGSAAAR